jgi:hypothetical protein
VPNRVFKGIYWVLRLGAPWRDLPDDFGPSPKWEKGPRKARNTVRAGHHRLLRVRPDPEPRALGEWLRAKRRALGFTIAEAPQWLEVDEGTFGKSVSSIEWQTSSIITQRSFNLIDTHDGTPFTRHQRSMDRFILFAFDGAVFDEIFVSTSPIRATTLRVSTIPACAYWCWRRISFP